MKKGDAPSEFWQFRASGPVAEFFGNSGDERLVSGRHFPDGRRHVRAAGQAAGSKTAPGLKAGRLGFNVCSGLYSLDGDKVGDFEDGAAFLFVAAEPEGP